MAVQYVAPGSPGDSAGIAIGDTIIRVGARPVRNFLDWEAALLDLGVGDTLHLAVRRADGVSLVALRSIELPSERAQRVALGDLELVTVTSAIQAERQLAIAHGALVVSVGAEAQAAGLQAGDVIYRINNEDITDADQVEEGHRLLPQPGRRRAVLRAAGFLRLRLLRRPRERPGPLGLAAGHPLRLAGDAAAVGRRRRGSACGGGCGSRWPRPSASWASPIPAEAIAQMKAHADDVDFAKAAEYERAHAATT